MLPVSALNMSMSIFPTELYECIIDYVGQAEDAVTLRVCALVSQSWYPRARLHLVRSVVLCTRKEVLGFAQMVRHGRGPMGLVDVGNMVHKVILRGVEIKAGDETKAIGADTTESASQTSRRSMSLV
ncbi:uncharacterized protein C8Q71DRAFT_741067 [Rhodofomes roseus]|uniref:F-box domain-containing protein n=1 Tax=Rhodofomes roseus TaxID=34475 RepID=A0ABQ8KQE4_9APHY|nr:uncharacterized protein C8Q71DRAFT_741067 [Rhodofomes roseus]KAH9840750.1 hypothetical protein C8Q71DRAFT_741067 [Rhodofomes roseus]